MVYGHSILVHGSNCLSWTFSVIIGKMFLAWMLSYLKMYMVDLVSKANDFSSQYYL